MRFLFSLLLFFLCWVVPAEARSLFKVEVEPYTEVQVFPLERTTDALDALREGRVEGGAVVQVR